MSDRGDQVLEKRRRRLTPGMPARRRPGFAARVGWVVTMMRRAGLMSQNTSKGTAIPFFIRHSIRAGREVRRRLKSRHSFHCHSSVWCDAGGSVKVDFISLALLGD